MKKLILSITAIATLISFSAQALDANSYLREKANSGDISAMREMDLVNQRDDFQRQQQMESQRQQQEFQRQEQVRYQQKMLAEQQRQTQLMQQNSYR